MAKWNMTAVVYIEMFLYLFVSVILYHLPWQFEYHAYSDCDCLWPEGIRFVTSICILQIRGFTITLLLTRIML